MGKRIPTVDSFENKNILRFVDMIEFRLNKSHNENLLDDCKKKILKICSLKLYIFIIRE